MNDILSGKTLGKEDGLVVNTMPNRGIFNLESGINVPEGYYSCGEVVGGKKHVTGTKLTLINVNDLGLYPSIVIISLASEIWRATTNNYPVVIN